MNSLRSAGNWVTSKTKGHAAATSKETNKTIAKDRNMSMGTRMRAAGNTVRDSMQEHSHKREASLHKNAAKHGY